MSALLRRRYLIPVLAGLLLTTLAVVLKTVSIPVLTDLDRRLEWLAYDLRMRLLLPAGNLPDPRIVIVDIDEKSLNQEGRWPWSRGRVAALADSIFEHGAAVLAMDVVFAEPQRDAMIELLESMDEATRTVLLENLNSKKILKSPDQRLAESLAGHDVVLGYTIAEASSPPKGALPPALVVDAGRVDALHLIEMDSYIANLGSLQENARSGGFFSIVPDADGVIRRAPLLARHMGRLYGSLALEAARLYQGAGPVSLNSKQIGEFETVESLSLDGVTLIPMDGAGSALIPYQGRSGSFHYLSAADVLNREVPPELLQDAIVVFGTTATGLYDMRATPVQGVFPGVEINANLIAGLLDGTFPFEPPWAPGANVAQLFLIGTLSSLVFPAVGALAVIVIALVLLSLVLQFNLWLWSTSGLVLAVVSPLLLVILIATLSLAYGFLSESHSRRQLKAVFGQYVPPERVEEMSRNPGAGFAVEGESRELSVLFCDIRSFTSISESLPADELKRMLNEFFTPMTRIIFKRNGTIDKYVGDMIMAFWGAPLHDPEHRLHAVQAALEMLERLIELRSEFRARNWPMIDIGVGINSGLMNVGDMGSEFRRSYTVIGDAVNLGSRLEGLTKYYGVRLIISETTAEGLDGIVMRRLDRVKVKGKNEPVTIYEPIGTPGVVPAALVHEVEDSNQALEYYFQGQWEAAEAAFRALIDKRSDRKLYSLYLGRIQDLQSRGVGEGWDGVFEHTTK